MTRIKKGSADPTEVVLPAGTAIGPYRLGAALTLKLYDRPGSVMRFQCYGVLPTQYEARGYGETAAAALADCRANISDHVRRAYSAHALHVEAYAALKALVMPTGETP